MHRSLLARWGLGVLAVAFVFSACGDEEVVVEPTDNPPTMDLTAPAGGSAIQPGSDVQITWTATDDNAVVGVDLFVVSAGGPVVIARDVTGSSFTWTAPNADLFAAKVRATAKDAAGQTATDESGMFAVVTHSVRGYVTSNTCKNCHIGPYTEVFASGHPYKINKVSGGPPTYPYSTVPNPPAGYSWNDITYVIGGFGWKTRYMDKDGYIFTDGVFGTLSQYNLPRSDLGYGANWAPYDAALTSPKPYNCGACHTTGWQTTAENGGVNQDGLIGIEGTWEETGISCEACHGPGATHVATQTAANIVVDNSAALCGSCHVRGDPATIPASGGFIRHHEQYNELLAGAHSARNCVDCHSPHKGVLYGQAAAGGIHTTCQDCHQGKTLNHVPIACEACHMARATKSAQNRDVYRADISTHLFRINTDTALTRVDMMGGSVAADYVSLDVACYQCHKDSSGVGGPRSAKSLTVLALRANVIH